MAPQETYTINLETLQKAIGLPEKNMKVVYEIYKKAMVTNITIHAMKLRHPTLWKQECEVYIEKLEAIIDQNTQKVLEEYTPKLTEFQIPGLVIGSTYGYVAKWSLYGQLPEEGKKELEGLHNPLELWVSITDLNILEDIFTTIHLGEVYQDYLVRRFLENPHAIELIALRDGMDKIIGKSTQKKALESLTGRLEEITKKITLPFDNDVEKKSLIGELITIQKSKGKNLLELIPATIYFPNRVQNRMISKLREQLRQEKYHKGKLERLDSEVKTAHSKQVQKLKLLENKYKSLQTTQPILEFEINDHQKNNLKKYLDEQEIKILEFIIYNQDDTQEEIAQKAECSQGEVSKTKSQYKKFEPQIRKILGLPEKK